MTEKTEHDRSKFIYDNGYGTTTDVYLLPVGTKFYVENGHWGGEIIEEDGKKVLLIANGRKIELKEDRDYSLVITIESK